MLPYLANTWQWWTSLFIVALIVFLLTRHVTFVFYAHRVKEDDYATVRVSMLQKLISFRLTLPSINVENKGIKFEVNRPSSGAEHDTHLHVMKAISSIEVWTESLQIYKENRRWLRSVFKKVKLNSWTWHTNVGTGDAASAAMSCGMLWSAKGVFLGVLSQLVDVKQPPLVTITPIFNEATFETKIRCRACIKLFHLLVAGCMLLFHIRSVKQGVHLWKMVTSKT